MSRLGIHFQLPFGDSAPATRKAEKKGVDSVWIQEDVGRDSISHLSALASVTTKMRLGTGILPAPFRTPVLTAMSIATLDEISGGRAVLGISVGHAASLPPHGAQFDRPIARLREYVQIVRKVLTGEEVSFEGRFYTIKKCRLRFEPRRREVPIYIAGRHRQMLELAGELGDGAMLHLVPATHFSENVMGWLEDGAKRSGRDPKKLKVAQLFPVCISDDNGRAKQAARRMLSYYLAKASGNNFLRQLGYPEEADSIKRAVDGGDREAAASRVSDRVVEDFAVYGDPKNVRSRLADYRRRGLDLPVVDPLPGDRPSERAIPELGKAAARAEGTRGSVNLFIDSYV